MNRYSLAIFAAAVVLLVIASMAPNDIKQMLADNIDKVEYQGGR